MVIKSGRYGKFLACPDYPACKSTLPYGTEEKEEIFEGVCPECGKPTKRLKTRTNKTYYGCSGYPVCKFMSWDIPTGERCPNCKSPLVRSPRGVVKCSNRECGYKVSSPRKGKEK